MASWRSDRGWWCIEGRQCGCGWPWCGPHWAGHDGVSSRVLETYCEHQVVPTWQRTAVAYRSWAPGGHRTLWHRSRTSSCRSPGKGWEPALHRTEPQRLRVLGRDLHLRRGVTKNPLNTRPCGPSSCEEGTPGAICPGQDSRSEEPTAAAPTLGRETRGNQFRPALPQGPSARTSAFLLESCSDLIKAKIGQYLDRTAPLPCSITGRCPSAFSVLQRLLCSGSHLPARSSSVAEAGG